MFAPKWDVVDFNGHIPIFVSHCAVPPLHQVFVIFVGQGKPGRWALMFHVLVVLVKEQIRHGGQGIQAEFCLHHLHMLTNELQASLIANTKLKLWNAGSIAQTR